MPKTIKYTGTQQRWPELSTTGKQSTWMPGQAEERGDVEAALLLATGFFSTPDNTLSATDVAALRAAAFGGAGNITREQLRLLAEANGLQPGARVRTVEGVVADCKTNRYLDSYNWFYGATRWNAGNGTSGRNVLSLMTPPVAVGGMIEMPHGGICTPTARTKRVRITLGGALTDAPGTAGINEYAWDRQLNTTGQFDWETITRIGFLANGICRARSTGNSSEGVGSTESRYFAMDLTAGRLLRVALSTADSGVDVAISTAAGNAGLQISGGYAYGTVAAGTFTGPSLVRTAKISGATGGNASSFNQDPVDIEILSAGLPSPTLPAVGTTGATVAGYTAFRYPVASGSGVAAGSPVLRLWDDLALEHLRVAIFQPV